MPRCLRHVSGSCQEWAPSGRWAAGRDARHGLRTNLGEPALNCFKPSGLVPEATADSALGSTGSSVAGPTHILRRVAPALTTPSPGGALRLRFGWASDKPGGRSGKAPPLP